jgi:hypothetical protein
MLDFVRRNRVAIASGLLLLLSLVLLSLSSRNRQRLDPLARLALEIMRPLQVLVTGALDGVSGAWHTYAALVGVRRENERLHEQVAALERQLAWASSSISARGSMARRKPH